MNTTAEQGISDIVGCLTDPLFVFPGGWEDTIPEWLKTAVTLERLAMNVKALKGDEPTGTDAEACVYLYTASLAAPMDHDWSQLYLYLATVTYKRWNGSDISPDIACDSLSDYQKGKLGRLKDWLYRQRIDARLEKKRAARRQDASETEALKTKEWPALFAF